MPFHPFLIPLYSILALYAENISEVSASAIWRLLIVSLLSVTVLLVLLYALTKNWQKSGLILSFLLILFLSYGHLYGFLNDHFNVKDVALGEVYPFRHPFLSIVWILLGLTGTFVILRLKDLRQLTLFVNSMSIFMLLFPVYNIGLYLYREQVYGSKTSVQTTALRLPEGSQAPDVYFIVLDAYGRKDVLQEEFGLDNSEFLRELQDLGFYVVACSQSNYARTRLSIVSTLNMEYVQNLLPEEQPSELTAQLKPYLSENKVRLLLEELGYQTIEFDNEFPWLKWKNATYYLQKGSRASVRFQLATALTPFEEMFLKTTLARAALDLRLAGASVSGDTSHRENVLYALGTLPEIPKIAGPKLVYAHLIVPHPPFVFGPNGENILLGKGGAEWNDYSLYADEAMRVAYRDQTIYTNKLAIPVLRSLIEESRVPPIIVLESDHGPTSYGGIQNRMKNLMAYYLPGKDAASLAYPSITPVNSFRLVFNTYFGGSYPLLKDVSYFSGQTTDVQYQIVPNACAGR
ncbi:MAG TPA: hypothetical protein VLE49_15075 [Anaerolineales bacterium]|nr:hypothetical protein [Anaerolineales bacterium]